MSPVLGINSQTHEVYLIGFSTEGYDMGIFSTTTFSTPTTESSSGLLGKVLGMVGFGFLLTALGAGVFSSIPYGLALALGFLNIGLIVAIRKVRDNSSLQMILLYVFTFIEGGAIGPTIKHYMHKIGPAGIAEATLITALGMFILGIVAYLINIDYKKLSGIGLAALLGLLGVMIVNIFTHFVHPHTIDWLVLGVFTIVTLADFARLRAGGDGETAVELALGIYLDALNIFLAVLDLLGSRD